MLPEQIMWVGALAIAVSYFFYFKSMFTGETRPNLVSWSLWMLGPMIGVFFQLKAGAGLSVIPVFTAGFGPLLVVVVSLFRRNSIWKITGFDMICGAFSLMALLCYILTKNLALSVVFAILSDALAFIPTYVKTWKFPSTESSSVYYASIFINILGLLVIKDWSFVIYSFSVYLALANLLLIMIIHRQKILFWYNH